MCNTSDNIKDNYTGSLVNNHQNLVTKYRQPFRDIQQTPALPIGLFNKKHIGLNAREEFLPTLPSRLLLRGILKSLFPFVRV